MRIGHGDAPFHYGKQRDRSDEKIERTVVLFDLPVILRDDAELFSYVESEGFQLLGAEIMKQSDGSPREFGIVELSMLTQVEDILNHKFDLYPEINVVELGMTIFPDCIGGTTSIS